ncbi:hypothetical protein D9758_018045 [Tetrapyrgos nigripes]|uniref:Reverse transcriptase n=1 Tax=Tetrapyrgos nigripes TaxID=182062 RepID=A0A8H5B646_9AGAR|nr:hypothetical protein D9758_018045 [Tetrapyrgos nigripes]
MKETRYGLSREVFGRITQCRTGHGFIGEYYKRFIPDENVDCHCGEALQTRDHILCSCPFYEPHRDLLREASENLELPELLGSKEGIEALTEFIQKSGAFTKTRKPLRPPVAPVYQPLDEPALMLHDEYWEDLTGGSEREVVTQEVVDDEPRDFGYLNSPTLADRHYILLRVHLGAREPPSPPCSYDLTFILAFSPNRQPTTGQSPTLTHIHETPSRPFSSVITPVKQKCGRGQSVSEVIYSVLSTTHHVFTFLGKPAPTPWL